VVGSARVVAGLWSLVFGLWQASLLALSVKPAKDQKLKTKDLIANVALSQKGK
jgi:hypothetical protein